MRETLKRYWRQALSAMVLGHLIFLHSWILLLGPSPREFLIARPPGGIAFLGLSLNILISTIGTFLVLRRAEENSKAYGALAIALVCLGCLSLARAVVPSLPARLAILAYSKWRPFAFAIPVIALVLAIVIQGLGNLLRACVRGLLVLSPLVPVLWFQAFESLTKRILFPVTPFSPVIEVQPVPEGKDVWILVFDELDYRICFETPGTRGRYPELNTLRDQAFSADRAYPPAGDTIISVPAMMRGEVIENTQPLNASTLLFKAPGRSLQTWDPSESLIGDLHGAGYRIAVAGWMIPYNRLFSRYAEESKFLLYYRYGIWQELNQSLTGSMMTQAVDLYPFIKDGLNSYLASPAIESRQQRKTEEELESFVDHLVEGSRLDFYWVHYPIPHGPAISGPSGSYLENIGYMDQALGRFRKAMSAKGRWDSSTVILIADHWLRKNSDPTLKLFQLGLAGRWDKVDHRIPFIVKFPGSKVAMRYSHPFNLTLLRKLIPEMMGGKVRTPSQLAEWIETQKGFGESPVTSTLP
ncbi:sulfatase-like hydrolase/transferase [Mesoterricola silvestris]|uniref:Sulfatase N-terminal domain-containing protein n=1 Tax=Mesoterricola silvestris TaxID=2927979 RepID=A0AA48GKG4_9BACT|nr:sulfatase-like hydrolase/transferase [Mesoterricola silvestris]BDU71080.1 hypothetical protein METEAL_02540 [Mesoterricola silvestris]